MKQNPVNFFTGFFVAAKKDEKRFAYFGSCGIGSGVTGNNEHTRS